MKTEEKFIEEGFESNGYRHRVPTEDGVEVFIRSVRPDDADLLRALFKSLSPESIYFRFFAAVKDFPDHMLERFARIDEDCEIALTALDQSGKMLGIACVVIMEDRVQAEFSVLVGDPWQGKGIGAELLRRCLMLAKQQQVHTVWGRVLPENARMLIMAQKLGFAKKQAPDANEYELTIDLRSLHL